MLTDTHAHLDFPDFADDLPGVLARAEAAGVKRIVSIGTSLESSRRAIALAEQYSNVFAVVGIHPNSVDDAPADAIETLRELARHPRVAAIGETGLDHYRLPGMSLRNPSVPDTGFESPELPEEQAAEQRDAAFKAAQADLFERQLDLAVELGLNVVVHQRAAWPETLEILEPYTGKLRAVFHCFGEPLSRAREVLALGHLVSFTGIVTFKNALAARETAAAVPADAFMAETDCPYLAPVPHRGKRCEPAHSRLVADQLAALRNVSLSALAGQMEETANGFFRFASP